MKEKLSDKFTVHKAPSGLIVGGTVRRDDKELMLTADGARDLVKDKRFFGACICRPIINLTAGFVQVGGEDDCPVHGFGGQELCEECEESFPVNELLMDVCRGCRDKDSDRFFGFDEDDETEDE